VSARPDSGGVVEHRIRAILARLIEIDVAASTGEQRSHWRCVTRAPLH
jgi:hypothetical protein